MAIPMTADRSDRIALVWRTSEQQPIWARSPLPADSDIIFSVRVRADLQTRNSTASALEACKLNPIAPLEARDKPKQRAPETSTRRSLYMAPLAGFRRRLFAVGGWLDSRLALPRERKSRHYRAIPSSVWTRRLV